MYRVYGSKGKNRKMVRSRYFISVVILVFENGKYRRPINKKGETRPNRAEKMNKNVTPAVNALNGSDAVIPDLVNIHVFTKILFPKTSRPYGKTSRNRPNSVIPSFSVNSILPVIFLTMVFNEDILFDFLITLQ